MAPRATGQSREGPLGVATGGAPADQAARVRDLASLPDRRRHPRGRDHGPRLRGPGLVAILRLRLMEVWAVGGGEFAPLGRGFGVR
jgi:hypothetical protein